VMVEHPGALEQMLGDRQGAVRIPRKKHALGQCGRRLEVVRADLVLERQGDER
jgi:hypothetical protein